ncbi:hypothetical protein BGP82_26565 [Pseudomonas putida]|uniref:Uncharacterized protein n=1 Tax=Pseudomonas putida TaxID=303 RepID=A0A2S3WLE2_PSEPU|nr:hypothetical protein [Pseudomonas putida]POG01012.1 hypothetical protein BGP82_26565 [Pseudomonas putida]
MSLTPEQEKKSPQSLEEVLRYIDMQVRRDFDLMRARHYWEKTLEGTPKDVLVEALSLALATGRYQMKPRCNCCRQC